MVGVAGVGFAVGAAETVIVVEPGGRLLRMPPLLPDPPVFAAVVYAIVVQTTCAG